MHSGLLINERIRVAFVLIPLNSGHAFGPSLLVVILLPVSLNPFEFRACIRAHVLGSLATVIRLNPFEFRACIRATFLQ